MPNSPVYGLRTPTDTDPPDVPADLARLADDLEVMVQAGTADLTGVVGSNVGVDVIFPRAFAAAPIAVVCPINSTASDIYFTWWISTRTATSLRIGMRRGNTQTVTFMWIAVGKVRYAA
jgi:hypothetical protein